MSEIVCDASIVLKWFHEEGEDSVAEARSLLERHRTGRTTLWIIELTFYELGNVLLRSLGWKAAEVADQLDDLRAVAPVLELPAVALRRAAELAETHELTFYDALYAAAAEHRDAVLVSADAALLACGLAKPVGELA